MIGYQIIHMQLGGNDNYLASIAQVSDGSDQPKAIHLRHIVIGNDSAEIPLVSVELNHSIDAMTGGNDLESIPNQSLFQGVFK
jgi:hypothetical protein